MMQELDINIDKNMKIILKLIIGLVILLIFCGCPDKPMDGKMIIENNSNDTIIYGFFTPRDITEINKNYWGYDYSKHTIFPNSFIIHEFNTGSAKHVLPRRYYLFNLDSIRTIPWERIRDERIILKEVIFNSLEEMEACNFTITYP